MTLPQRMALASIVLGVVLLVGAASAVADDWLDSSYGVGGVSAPFLPPEASAREAGIVDLAAAPASAAYGALRGLGDSAFFGVVRLDAKGDPSAAFGGDGFTDPLALPGEGFNREAQAEAIVRQPDGKVVVVGYAQEGLRQPTSTAPLVARYDSTGALDPSFAGDGLITPRHAEGGGTVYHDVAVSAGGRILAVGGRGESSLGGIRSAGVINAYLSDGSLDATFGKGGKVVIAGDGSSYTSLRSVRLLPNGELLVAGYLDDRLYVARLRQDGSPDRRFAAGGQVTVNVGNRLCCETAALAVASTGRISVAANGGSLRRARVFLVQLRRDGSRETRFGVDGVEAPASGRRLGQVTGVAVQADGGIVMTGRGPAAAAEPQGDRYAISRTLPSGRPDQRFGRRGLKVFSAAEEGSADAALALSGGGVLTGGSFLSRTGEGGAPGTTLLLARLRGSS